MALGHEADEDVVEQVAADLHHGADDVRHPASHGGGALQLPVGDACGLLGHEATFARSATTASQMARATSGLEERSTCWSPVAVTIVTSL